MAMREIYDAILKHRDAQKYLEFTPKLREARVGAKPRRPRPDSQIVSFRVSGALIEELERLVREGKVLNRSQAIEDCFWIVVERGLLDELIERSKKEFDAKMHEYRQRALAKDPALRWLERYDERWRGGSTGSDSST